MGRVSLCSTAKLAVKRVCVVRKLIVRETDLSMIKSLKEASREWLKERADQAAVDFKNSFRLVYGADESYKPRPEATGTCFFLKVRGACYLVTAAHVLDDAQVSTLYVAAGGEGHPIVGEFTVTIAPESDRGNDRLDFAFRRLDEADVVKLHDVHFIDAIEISENRADSSERFYIVMGFPVSLNKKFSATERVVRSRAWQFQDMGFVPDAQELEKIGCNVDQHLFLKYSNQTSDYEGIVQNSLSPKGVSGGPLFDLGRPSPNSFRPEASKRGLLAGMFIEKRTHSNTMVFTKIQVIVRAIENAQDMEVRLFAADVGVQE